MKKVLLTGGSGFIGRNILPILREKYEVLAPTRNELDVSNDIAVQKWLSINSPDIVVHCAICNPNKEVDEDKNVFEDMSQMFLSLMKYKFEKFIYIGSGAEFDKSNDIYDVKESDFGTKIPADDYGFARFLMTHIARNSKNIYNLRIFGCYGPEEPERRFIRHAIDCCFNDEVITINQNKFFSYVYVEDIGRAIIELIEKQVPLYHDYNFCEGTYQLVEIASVVKKIINNIVPYQLIKDGFGEAYSGSSDQFKTEFSDFKFTSLEDGIKKELNWYKEKFR